MGNLNFNLSQIGIGALRRIAISAVALLGLSALVLGGPGEYRATSAQGIGPDPEAIAPAPGGGAPGTNPGTQPPAMLEDPSAGIDLSDLPQLRPGFEPPSPADDDPLTEDDPPNTPQQPPAIPETATFGFGGLGLINGLHYPSDRFIIRYKHQPGLLGTVNENSTATATTLLSEIEAQNIQVALSEDLTTLAGGFDILNVQVTGGVSERNTYFVRADGAFDPLEVSFALNELEDVEYAHPDYYFEPTQSRAPTQGDCFRLYSSANPDFGSFDPCRGEESEWARPSNRRADWYIGNINLDAALSEVMTHQGDNPDPIVAVIDTAFTQVDPDDDFRIDSNGEPLTNPDLDGRWYFPEEGFWPFRNRDEIDILENDTDPFVSTESHGSQVASLLAGKKGNRYGAYGVYQGGNETILPLRIADPEELPGNGNDAVNIVLSNIIGAVRMAQKHDAQIINASISSVALSTFDLPPGVICGLVRQDWDTGFFRFATVSGKALRDEIADFDGLYVAAAGNYNSALNATRTSLPQIFAEDVLDANGNVCEPKLGNLINVAATQLNYPFDNVVLWRNPGVSSGDKGSGSNYSTAYVEIAAPGRSVFVSSGNEERFTTDDNVGTGTSFAAPLVAGTAALMLQVNDNLTPAQKIAIISFTGRNEPNLNRYVAGGKTLDAEAAVKCARKLADQYPGNHLSSVSQSTFESNLATICSDAVYEPEFSFSSSRGSGPEDSSWRYIWINLTDGEISPSAGADLELRWGGTARIRYDYWNKFSYRPWNSGYLGSWTTVKWDSNPQSFNFPSNATRVRLAFYVFEDYHSEWTENLRLTLSSSDPNVSIGRSRYTYTIYDDD